MKIACSQSVPRTGYLNCSCQLRNVKRTSHFHTFLTISPVFPIKRKQKWQRANRQREKFLMGAAGLKSHLRLVATGENPGRREPAGGGGRMLCQGEAVQEFLEFPWHSLGCRWWARGCQHPTDQLDVYPDQGFWWPLPNAMAVHAGCQRKIYVGITHPTPRAKHLKRREKKT